MRPIRLELRGFTAFRERTVVEFEGRQLFAITGPTGAGKSSLLDAMTWALFGQVPRVGSSTRQLVSHGATSMQVRFDFATRDEVYRVVRKAPAVTGTRLEHQQADGSWRHLADRSRDVTREVTRLLGMDFTTFTRTVLLPQGEFDAFLKGEQSERRAILTKLLGLSIYDDARKIANERAKAAKERSATIEAQLAQLNLASPERIAELEIEHTSAQGSLAELNTRREALRGLGDLARAARDAGQAQHDAETLATAAREALSAADQACAAASNAVVDAERHCDALSRDLAAVGYDSKHHQSLLAQIERINLRESAERDVAEAKQRLEAATAAHAAATAEAASATTAATEAATAAEAADRALEGAATTLAEATGAAQTALTDLETRVTATTAELEAARRERATLAEQLPKLLTITRQLNERTAARDTAAGELATATTARTQSEEAATAAEAQVALDTIAVEATRGALADARHADLAATLRAGLKPGDPCPVCGERITQMPMEFGAADLATAEAAVSEAERLLEEHRRTSTEARTIAAAAAARADGLATTVASADALLEAIDLELTELKTSRDGLPATLEERQAALASAERSEATSGDVATAIVGQRDTLRLALAAVPDEVVAAEGAAATADPEPVVAALDGWRSAHASATQGAARLQEQLAARAKFQQAIAAAEAHVEAATVAVAQAEQRLVGHSSGPAGTEVSALREALDVAEQASKRSELLDAQISTARAAIAAATATRTAAEGERVRRTEGVTAASGLAGAATGSAATAQSALTEAWRDSIGDDSAPSFETLRELMLAHDADQQAAGIRAGVLGEQIAQAKRETIDAERMRGEIASDRAIADLNGALATELKGDRFVGYVQREAMQLLAADASFRLVGFTGGRYELASEDNEFMVVDRLNGDEQRSVKTLSGGETFLASLALALSLSEHLPQLAGLGGAVSLESLFLDEGFGALDSDSLDLAVQGLETLASSRRMIGVISHVQEMAERLPEQIEVVKSGNASMVRG